MTQPPFPIDNYEIGPRLDKETGAFGVVYRARRLSDGLIVALKRVSPNDGNASAKIKAEERGARLQDEFSRRHPDLVPKIYEYGKAHDHFYISMELIDAPSLQTLLSQERFSERRAVGYAFAIARFLVHLHSFHRTPDISLLKRIVHADLKPAHIRILGDRNIRVLDFGIAKALFGSHPATKSVHANEMYSSPEQLEGRKVDIHMDLWALGVMLFEMASGSYPFRATKDESLSDVIKRREPPALPDTCSKGLRAVVHKSMEPAISDRYQSATEIVRDLACLLEGRLTSPERKKRRRSQRAMAMDIDAPTTESSAETTERRSTTVTSPATTPSDDQASTLPTPVPTKSHPPVRPPRPLLSRRRVAIGVAAIVGLVLVVLEASSGLRAEELRRRIPMLELGGVDAVRLDYDALFDQAPLGLVARLRVPGVLRTRLAALADETIRDYRQDRRKISFLDWWNSQSALSFEVSLSGDQQRRARLAYVDGHLSRMKAENSTNTHESASYEDALQAFEESARLDRTWPDPYLGLARVHAIGLKDPESVKEDIDRAALRGFRPTSREAVLLAFAHALRSDQRRQRARTSFEADARERLLDGANRDARACIEMLSEHQQNHDAITVRTRCVAQLRQREAYD